MKDRPSAKKPDAPTVFDDVESLVQGDRAQTAALLEQFRAAVRKCIATLPAVVALTRDERRYNKGRLAADEIPVLRVLLDLADAQPALFASLAPSDHGTDPGALETGPARHALEVLTSLVPLVDELAAAHRTAQDLALRLGELTRSVTTPVHEIAKANARVNPKVRADLARVTAYYQERARVKKPAGATKKAADPPEGGK